MKGWWLSTDSPEKVQVILLLWSFPMLCLLIWRGRLWYNDCRVVQNRSQHDLEDMEPGSCDGCKIDKERSETRTQHNVEDMESDHAIDAKYRQRVVRNEITARFGRHGVWSCDGGRNNKVSNICGLPISASETSEQRYCKYQVSNYYIEQWQDWLDQVM